MGVILEIAVRLLARVALTAIVGGLSFLGYETGGVSYTASSTPLSPLPIVVTVEDKANIDTPTTTLEASPVATSTKTVVKKPTQTKPVKIAATTTPEIPKVVTQSQPETTTTKTPSLSNLPVPSIQLPSASQIVNGIDFGIFNSVYQIARQSVVNILCISQKGNLITVSTGSGVIVDPQGIILTNSHVAETMLVPGQDCTIRQGDIAVDTYKASLIYINTNWLSKNAGLIFSGNARGTGENDFAFLAITQKADGSSFSGTLPYAKPHTQELDETNKNDAILVAGYPGGTLGALTLRQYLPFSADQIHLTNIFTFSGKNADILETEATKVGQHGASGGAVLNVDGELVGLIDSTQGTGNVEKINALSIPYISRTLQSEVGQTIQGFTSTDKTAALTSFEQKRAALFEYVKPYVQ